nr:hypothetical protein [Tanacetum cinerariifolium]
MRSFLWCQDRRKGKSKVAWELVCLPRDEGGLGLRRLDCFNKALIASHLWKLIYMKESLWVKWVHAYKLRGQSFWDVPIHSEISWGWRKVLQLRPLIREFVWHNFGNGALTSLWVCNIVQDDGCSWPDYFVSKYPFLDQLVMPNRSTRSDAIEWRDETGVVKPFSVSMVWEAIRHRNVKVPWSDIVWFSSYLLPFANRRSSRSVISKLVVAACAYFIRQERNSRLFKKKKRLVK